MDKKERVHTDKRTHDPTTPGPGQPDQPPEPEEEIWGLDLVDMTPDYSKSYEENEEIWAQRYKDVYGKWPSWMPEGPKGQDPGEKDTKE